MTRIAPPGPDEYGAHYAGYIAAVPLDQPVLAVLETQLEELLARLATVSEERARYRYAPGKWSLKEVVGHLTDTERVMAYRALRIGRGDSTPLPGFDENAYVAAMDAERQALAVYAAEFGLVRRATLALLRQMPEAAWSRRGEANGMPLSVRALAYIMAGHVTHHVGVLASRYGLELAPQARGALA